MAQPQLPITTKKVQRVEYIADTGVEGLQLSAICTGNDINEGRVTFRYSDIEGSGQITVAQKWVDLIMGFMGQLQVSEAIRLGLIPDPNAPTPPGQGGTNE